MLNGTRVTPVAPSITLTSTSGNCAPAIVAVWPSTRSMFAPTGSGNCGEPLSTKLPPASVKSAAEPRVTVTPGIGWGTASAVRTRPVTAWVPGARTSSVNVAVRVTVRPSTSASPVTAKL